jgi:mRNA interferase RelE/StbE
LPELRLTRRALNDLRDLPRPIQEAVLETLDRIAVDPTVEGKELIGHLRGLWSARVGSYRVLYTVERRFVVVRGVRHLAVAARRTTNRGIAPTA